MEESFTLGQRSKQRGVSRARGSRAAEPPPKHARPGRRAIGRIPAVVIVSAVAVVALLLWFVLQ